MSESPDPAVEPEPAGAVAPADEPAVEPEPDVEPEPAVAVEAEPAAEAMSAVEDDPVVEAAGEAEPAPPRPAVPSPAVLAHLAAAATPGQAWGRVDPDGSVFVRTAEGEVSVGSFQAGSPHEAMAYFTRKFAALELEVDLLEKRVANPEVPPEESASTYKRLNEAVTSPSSVGDIDGLRVRLAALAPAIEARRAEARAAREAAKAEAKEARERIVAEAESLADSVQWKVAGERLRTLLDEWKIAPHVDRATEQAMWKRFGAARNAFDRRRRHHFAQLSAQQGEAKAAKLAIIAEAEACATSTDWAATATALRGLMDRWKAAGRLGRSDEEALWQRFRGAQDTFFAARSATFSQRDAGLSENLKAKEGLLAEADALLPVSDLGAAKAALRSIQDRWEKVGHVPRGDKDRIDGRLKRVEDTVRGAEDKKWTRTNPEGLARAQAAVDQLQAGIAKLEAELAKAEAKPDARAVTKAQEALDARRSWLTAAEATLAEFGG